jgi:hypothetical protein
LSAIVNTATTAETMSKRLGVSCFSRVDDGMGQIVPPCTMRPS